MGKRRARAAALMLAAAIGCFPARALGSGAQETLVWVDLQAMNLIVYVNHQEAGRWPIACGSRQTPTPVGVFTITHRFRAEGTGFGSCFLGLDVPWGDYGIHGTNQPHSIGSRASHGCIRMYNRDVEKVYRLVPNGTRVVIEDGPYGEISGGLGEILPGERGAGVLAAQRKLKALGFYGGALDGIYGAEMERGLSAFCKSRGIQNPQKVNAEIWEALGVIWFE